VGLTYPSVDESLDRLHRAGRSVGEIGTAGGQIRVIGTNGENRLETAAATPDEAWRRASEEAAAVGMLAPPAEVGARECQGEEGEGRIRGPWAEGTQRGRAQPVPNLDGEALPTAVPEIPILPQPVAEQGKVRGLHRLAQLDAAGARLAGSEDVNDAKRLCLDPALRTVVGGQAKDQAAASTSEMARFETTTLSTSQNLKHLVDLSGTWIDQAHQHRKLAKLILDMDSSVSETYGHQERTAYNGYFACTCYHPLFLFNQFGDLERVLLRRGNHPSAKFWRRVLLPVIERYRDRHIPKYF
jgi:Transposase DDE domain group 1